MCIVSEVTFEMLGVNYNPGYTEQRKLQESLRIILLSQVCMSGGKALDSMPLKMAPELDNCVFESHRNCRRVCAVPAKQPATA